MIALDRLGRSLSGVIRAVETLTKAGVLTGELRDRGYELRDYEVEASSLGVPQLRRRLVVVAVKGSLALPVDVDTLARTSGLAGTTTAGAALDRLGSQLQAEDEWHRWRTSSSAVAARIAAVPVGGNRFDLPPEHRLNCHERLVTAGGVARRVATGSYGRVRADAPSPTMTTRCTAVSCGSFIHPTANRGLNLREAASLQTFPHDYRWHGGYDSVERQIGNAFPVRMAEASAASSGVCYPPHPSPVVVSHVLPSGDTAPRAGCAPR